jgi:hypothetical protein
LEERSIRSLRTGEAFIQLYVSEIRDSTRSVFEVQSKEPAPFAPEAEINGTDHRDKPHPNLRPTLMISVFET